MPQHPILDTKDDGAQFVRSARPKAKIAPITPNNLNPAPRMGNPILNAGPAPGVGQFGGANPILKPGPPAGVGSFGGSRPVLKPTPGPAFAPSGPPILRQAPPQGGGSLPPGVRPFTGPMVNATAAGAASSPSGGTAGPPPTTPGVSRAPPGSIISEGFGLGGPSSVPTADLPPGVSLAPPDSIISEGFGLGGPPPTPFGGVGGDIFTPPGGIQRVGPNGQPVPIEGPGGPHPGTPRGVGPQTPGLEQLLAQKLASTNAASEAAGIDVPHPNDIQPESLAQSASRLGGTTQAGEANRLGNFFPAAAPGATPAPSPGGGALPPGVSLAPPGSMITHDASDFGLGPPTGGGLPSSSLPDASPGSSLPQATGPVGGSVPAGQLSSFGPESNLLGSQINPGADPRLAGVQGLVDQATQAVGQGDSRRQIAADALSLSREQSRPGFERELRDVGKRAASLGRIGAGITTNELTDVQTRRDDKFDLLQRDLSLRAADAEIGDRRADAGLLSGLEGAQFGQGLSNRNELRGERGFQTQQNRTAIEDALRQILSQDFLAGTSFDRQSQRANDLGRFGFGFDPTSTLLAGSDVFGTLANQSGAQNAGVNANQAFFDRLGRTPGGAAPVTPTTGNSSPGIDPNLITSIAGRFGGQPSNPFDINPNVIPRAPQPTTPSRIPIPTFNG